MRPPCILFLILLLASGAGEPMVGPAWERFQGRTKRLAARRGAVMVLQFRLWLSAHWETMWPGRSCTQAFRCGQHTRSTCPSPGFTTCTTSTTSPILQYSGVWEPIFSNSCLNPSCGSSGWDCLQDNCYSQDVLDACFPSTVVTRAYNGVFSESPQLDGSTPTCLHHAVSATAHFGSDVGRATGLERANAKTGLGRANATTGLERDVRQSGTTSTLVCLPVSGAAWESMVHGLRLMNHAGTSAWRLVWSLGPLGLLVLLVLMLPVCAADTGSDGPALQHARTHPAHTLRFHPNPHTLVGVVTLSATALALGALCHMMPTASVSRMPPVWDPSNQAQYPFRRWSHDVLVWSVATEGDPARKAALLCMSLRGSAQELVRTLPPAVLVQGGRVNGAAVLAERFSALGEEVRLSAVTELLTFDRQGAESVDNIINRFDVVRQRAHDQGQLVMSITGLTWLLLRAIGVSDHQLLTLLAPFNGVFPQTDAELAQLKTQLRRMGHILEHAPGNIAASLRPQRNATCQNFWAQAEVEATSSVWHAAEGEASNVWDAHPDASMAPGSGWGTEQPSATAWMAQEFEVSDGGTDTDTASSDGGTELPPCTPEGSYDDPAIGEHLFWAYQKAKSQWRRWSQKPTRTVRRHVRRFIRHKGLGKGYGSKSKGKGKSRPNPSAFLASLSDDEVQQVFKVAGKGKGKGGKRSTGKGKGRRTNPKGKDGMTMRCFRCGSETHLSKDCHLPRDPNHRQTSSAAPSFHVNTIPEGGPLSMVFMASPSDDSWSMPSEVPQPQPDPWAEYLRGMGAFSRQAQPSAADPPSGVDRGEGSSSSGLGAGVNVGADPAEAQPPMPGPPFPLPLFTGPASTVPLYVAQPPPSLPPWATMSEFSFVQQPLAFVNPEQEPMIPVRDGLPSVQSTLEPINAQLVSSLHSATAATTLRWLNKPPDQTAPTTEVTSQLHEVHHASIEAFAHAQRTMQERRTQAKRTQKALHLPRADDLQAYDEQDTMCSLCQEEFGAGESVVRLVRRHLFHTHCWTSYLVHEEARMQCPNCHGSTRIIARFNYVSHSVSGTPQPPASPGGSSNASRGGQGAQEYPLTPPGRAPNPDVQTPSPFRDAPGATGPEADEYILAMRPIRHAELTGRPSTEPCSAEVHQLYQSLLGAVAYALLSQAWAAVFVIALQRRTSNPLNIHVRRLNLLLAAMQRKLHKVVFPAMTCQRRLVAFSDASFDKEGDSKGYGMRGSVFLRWGVNAQGKEVCHLLEAQSQSLKLVTRSTFSSETLAAVGTVDQLVPMLFAFQEVLKGPLSSQQARTLREKGGFEMASELIIDAMNLFWALSATSPRMPAERTLFVHINWLRDLLQSDMPRVLKWMDTRGLLADGMTKGKIDRGPLVDAMSGKHTLHPDTKIYRPLKPQP